MVTAIRFNLRPSQRNQERFERWALLDPDRTKKRDPEWFEAFDTYVVSRGRARHVKRTMRHLVAPGKKRVPDADFRRIGVPAVLVWGKHDRMVPSPWPRRRATSSTGRCTSSTILATFPISNNPKRFGTYCVASSARCERLGMLALWLLLASLLSTVTREEEGSLHEKLGTTL
jgi:hypothetical protein